MRLAKVSDLGWLLQCQDAMSKVRYSNVVTQIMHNVSIPVNGGKLRGWKYDFLEKSVGGCSTYDVIAPWPDLTRPICFCQKLRKRCFISYAKFQRDLSSSLAAILENTHGGLHWRGSSFSVPPLRLYSILSHPSRCDPDSPDLGMWVRDHCLQQQTSIWRHFLRLRAAGDKTPCGRPISYGVRSANRSLPEAIRVAWWSACRQMRSLLGLESWSCSSCRLLEWVPIKVRWEYPFRPQCHRSVA